MQLTPEIKYRLLLEIAQKNRDTLDIDEILNHLLDTVGSIIGYDAAGIFVLKRDLVNYPDVRTRGMIAGVARRGFDERPPESDPMLSSGKGIIGHVIRSGESLVLPDVRQDPRYVVGRSRTLSEIAVPILRDGLPVGALNLESDRLAAYDASELDALQFFAEAAAISIEKALLHQQLVEKELIEEQLETARVVQSRLLPRGSPGIPGFDIAGLCIPSGQIGGDYFDFIHLPHRRLGIVVADVSGHGIPSALVMTAFRALLRTRARSRSSPARLAGSINRLLPEFTGDKHFVTAFYALLDPKDNSLRYTSCGHPPALLLRAGDDLMKLESRGPALGILHNSRYQTGATQLEPGDILLLYTDGVVEIRDRHGNDFGAGRLVELMRSLRQLPAADLLQQVLQAVHEFSELATFQDDFTLLALKKLDQV